MSRPPVRKQRSTPRIRHDRISRHAEWSGCLIFNRSYPAVRTRVISIVELKSRVSAVYCSMRLPCPNATFPPDVPNSRLDAAEAANRRRLSGVGNAGPSRLRVPGRSQADPLEHPPVRDLALARCRLPRRRLLGPRPTQSMNPSRHFLLILTLGRAAQLADDPPDDRDRCARLPSDLRQRQPFYAKSPNLIHRRTRSPRPRPS